MARPRLAVVEDNPDNRTLVTVLLRDTYDLSNYGDGRTALAAFGELMPDLVLLDMGLPDMGGEDVVREMRRQPALQHIPVIALTAHAMQGDRGKYLAAGCSDYISKPILNFAEFRARIAAALQARG